VALKARRQSDLDTCSEEYRPLRFRRHAAFHLCLRRPPTHRRRRARWGERSRQVRPLRANCGPVRPRSSTLRCCGSQRCHSASGSGPRSAQACAPSIKQSFRLAWLPLLRLSADASRSPLPARTAPARPPVSGLLCGWPAGPLRSRVRWSQGTTTRNKVTGITTYIQHRGEHVRGRGRAARHRGSERAATVSPTRTEDTCRAGHAAARQARSLEITWHRRRSDTAEPPWQRGTTNSGD
jgi:hypothetical protein